MSKYPIYQSGEDNMSKSPIYQSGDQIISVHEDACMASGSLEILLQMKENLTVSSNYCKYFAKNSILFCFSLREIKLDQ